jgi:hypothetical protein
MPGTFDMAAANAALKELYGPQVLQEMMYTDNPAIAMMPKFEEAGGDVIPWPVVWAAGQGASSNFAKAQANQTAPKIASFLLTTKDDYQLATIANKLVKAAATDKMAFLRPMKLQMDGAMLTLSNRTGGNMYRSGTGSIGKIATGGITSGVITLDDPESVTQFERDMVLQANATDGGASPRAAYGYVIAVDRQLGTVTVASSGLGGAAGSPASWTAGDFILADGDNNAKPTGLAGWIPTSTPSSGESFFSVDRSVDTRLSGVRYDGSSLPPEEALKTLSKFISREGGRTDAGFTNYTSYDAVEKSLGNKVQYVDVSNGIVGFRGITIRGHKGDFDLFADRNCPGFLAYLLQWNTWKMLSTGPVPFVFSMDGNTWLRVSNADSMEVRLNAYYQFANNAPGWNGVVQLGA